ncbi:MAG: dockerin type I repeat-containing protein, partial [Prevotellaceae bacterium]|nr:dockerin type I repeat-containing protein [Candidatus Colivivens caballi]
MKKLFTLAMLAISLLTANAQNQLVEGEFNVGDKVTIDGKEWLVGKNIITNPSFEADPAKNGNAIVGWTVGNYAPMTTSNFLWKSSGGHDGGAYIQASGHTGSNGNNSVCQRWIVEPQSYYYFSFWLSNNSANNQYIPVVTLTNVESTGGGQNEKLSEGAKQLIGKNGEDSGDILGYGNFIDANGDGYGEWAQTGMVFESEEYTFLQFNARWLKENKIQACFDDFHLHKLYDPETTTPEEIAIIALLASVEEFDIYLSDDLGAYPGFQEEAADWWYETGYEDYDTSYSLEEIQTAIKDIENMKQKMNNAVESARMFDELLALAESIIEETAEDPYPGIDALLEACDTFREYQANGYYSDNDEILASEYIFMQIEALKKAISDYRTSQPADAEHPANYSYLIQNPEFVNKDAEPTYDDEGNPTYPNGDSYTSGSAPADGNSTGWYIGEAGGDQRLNYVQGRVCWNAWRAPDAASSVSINQEITELPDGVYSLSAYMITQPGFITDQHIFANGSIQNGVSATLSKDTWNSTDNGEWDLLTTNKVIVNDGKLKIGAYGSFPGGSAAGWFCVTHFVLNYYGQATEEDVINLYNSRITDFTAYAQSMGFAADRNAFIQVINDNSGLTDYNEIQNALVALNEAYETAKASQTEYEGVISGTYANLQDSINTAYPEYTKAVAQVIVDLETQFLESDDATYTESGAKTTILRLYRDELLPVLSQCESKMYTNTDAKARMESTLNKVVSALLDITEFPTTDKVQEYIENLKAALKACDLAEEVGDITDNMDLTAAISNPTIENSNNQSVPAGWDITMKGSGNALYTNVGQEYNGGNGAYLDAWNGTAGALLYTAKQTLNVPNGQYELKVMTRTSGQGFYVFATPGSDDAKSVFQHVNMEEFDWGKYMDSTSDSIATVSDTYGSIWEAAVNELANFYGIDGPTTDGVGNPYSIIDQIREITEDDVNTVPEELREAFNIAVANDGKGRGWHYYTLPVEVTNHKLTIGVSNDSTFTLGHKDTEGNDCVAFTGTWISADNWTLRLITADDNTGWSFASEDVIVGDADANGEVNGADISVIASYILGDEPDPFDAAAADFDGNEEINVNDISGVANFILYGAEEGSKAKT